ncbi:Gfo/Idh/MocA family protein [Microlunatus ginsengisoli]|uniref:Gfo/Idh/MocA family oxidoreductase n=1 Tax=Microlunatus ginsengisoli TaxID=363863 RepID=A0ABP7ATK3_9ACTN
MTNAARPVLRVGVVGAGVMARIHAENLVRLGHRVLIHAQAGAETLAGLAEMRASYDELLAESDWILIATPTDTHHELAMQAIAAGRDLIVEKPLARTYAQAVELVAAAASAGRRLYPAHVVRFFPEYAALHGAVTEGAIGTPAVLRFTRSGSFPIRAPWFGDPVRSGGIVFDQLIHDLDIARWLAGEVDQVTAIVRHDDSGPAPVQAAHVTLRHRSGAISLASGVWGAQHVGFTTSFSVAGTGGLLEHESAREQPMIMQLDHDQPADGLLPSRSAAADPYLDELAAFLQPDRDSPPARIVTAADGAEAVRLAEAALASLRSGQPVEPAR